MKILALLTILVGFCSLHGQSIDADSIDFYDELKFTKKVNYTSNDKFKNIEYTAIHRDLRRIEFYNTSQRLIKVQVWKGKLVSEITYSYLEKGQIIKRYDVLNKMELPTEIAVEFKYPALAREEGIEGEVLIAFQFNDECIPTSFKALNSLGYGIDKEVNKKMKLLIKLSQKYNISSNNCAEMDKPFTIRFKLD